MNPLPPIPTPPTQRWREFRIRAFPTIVFAAAVVASVVLWRTYVAPPTMVGLVEAVQANVASMQPGILTQLNTERFSRVNAGDPIATVITTDPKVVESSLAVIKAEVALLHVSMAPMLNKERNQLDFERLRLELLDQRVQLAAAKVKLHYAKSEFQRVSGLFQTQSNIVSKMDYEIALRDQDALQAEIERREVLIAEMESGMGHLSAADPAKGPDPNEALRAAIAVEEERLKLTEQQLKPIALKAPISGEVSMVYRRSGESIVAGEPVITITETQPKKIIAYMPQPLSVEPSVGMKVKVRARTAKRPIGFGKVEQVAAHFAPIPPVLLSPALNRPTEMGVPVDISIPDGLSLRAGEPVDLCFVAWRR